MKLKSITVAILATITLIATSNQASARNNITIVKGEQVSGTQLEPGAFYEVLRIPLEIGSGPSDVSALHLWLDGAPEIFDELVAVSEEDKARIEVGKNGELVEIHDIKEHIVGRLKIGYGFCDEIVVPVDNDLVHFNGARKTYVVYGLVSNRSYQHGGENVRVGLNYIDADENTEVRWMYDANPVGNQHTVSWDYFFHSNVEIVAGQNIIPTVVDARKVGGRRVTLGTMSVYVSDMQAHAESPEFELRFSVADAKLLAGLVNVALTDGNGKPIPGTKPVKPQFKLAGDRIKVSFPGLKLYFEEGITSFGLMGTFSYYNLSKPPSAVLKVKPQDWIWKDATGARVPVNIYFQNPTVVCPPIKFAPKGGPRG